MKNKQRGFALVSAIFLLVVIASLGLFAVTISTTQQQTSVQDLLGSRAYQAAKAGIEWGAYQATRAIPICAASTTVALPAGQLLPFKVTVECDKSEKYEGTVADKFYVYQIKSTATTGAVGSIGYFERQLQMTLVKKA